MKDDITSNLKSKLFGIDHTMQKRSFENSLSKDNWKKSLFLYMVNEFEAN